MKASFNSDGTVTIQFNIQVESLRAPDELHYLPCEDCFTLVMAQPNVVCVTCSDCEAVLRVGNSEASSDSMIEYEGLRRAQAHRRAKNLLR